MPPFIDLEKMGIERRAGSIPLDRFKFEEKPGSFPLIYHDQSLFADEKYFKAVRSFCRKWRDVNYDREKMNEHDYLQLLKQFKKNMMKSSLLYSSHFNIPIVSDTKTLLAVPKISSRMLASVLAIEALKIFLPKVKTLELDEILELRYRLRDYLPSFWREMRRLTYDLKLIIRDDTDIQTIQNEAMFIIETRVEPELEELRNRIKDKKDKFFRKVLGNILQTSTLSLDFGSMGLSTILLKIVGKIGCYALDLEDAYKDRKNLQSFLLCLEPEANKIISRRR